MPTSVAASTVKGLDSVVNACFIGAVISSRFLVMGSDLATINPSTSPANHPNATFVTD
jgi:hypothetical protein